MKLNEAKQILNKNGYKLIKENELNEDVFTVAAGVAIGILALKALKTVCGIGKTVLQAVAEGCDLAVTKNIPLMIEKNKVEIAEEIKNSIMNDGLYGEEVRNDLENKTITKEKIKTVLKKQLHMSILGHQKFTNKTLDLAADKYHQRKLRIQGFSGGSDSYSDVKESQELSEMIIDKLTDVTYETIMDVKQEI